jgi:hypothetical protein
MSHYRPAAAPIPELRLWDWGCGFIFVGAVRKPSVFARALSTRQSAAIRICTSIPTMQATPTTNATVLQGCSFAT